MVHTCFLCKWRSDKEPKCSFHIFPSDKYRRQKWLDIIGKSDAILGKGAALCSRHFEKNCFRYGLVRGRQFLKENSLPSLNVTNNIDIVQNTERNENEISPFSSEFQLLSDITVNTVNFVHNISIAPPSKDSSVNELTYQRTGTALDDDIPSSDTVVNDLNDEPTTPPSKDSSNNRLSCKRSGASLDIDRTRKKICWTKITIKDFTESPFDGKILLEKIKDEIVSKNKKISSLKREVRRLRHKLVNMKSLVKELS